MSFVCPACRSAFRLRRFAHLKHLRATSFPVVRRHVSSSSAVSESEKYERYAQDIRIPSRLRQRPSGAKPRGARERSPASVLLSEPAIESNERSARPRESPGLPAPSPLLPGAQIHKRLEPGARAIKKQSFQDLDVIYQHLLKNPDPAATKFAYEMFQRFQGKFGFARVVDTAGYLEHDRAFRLLMQRVAQHHGTEPELPNPRNLLDQYMHLGVDLDIHWADMMFGYVRNEDDEEVMAIWREYLQGQLRQKRRRPKQVKGAENANWDGETMLCSIAAMAAFFRINSRTLRVPTLADLIFQLRSAGEKGEPWSLNLPQTSEIRKTLSSYSLPQNFIQATVAELLRLRPYSDIRDKRRIALLDQITYFASVRDDAKLAELYQKYKAKDEAPHMAVFSAFINAFVECGKLQAMSRVWSDMVTSGQIPGIRAWGALLDGAAKSGNVQVFEETWAEIVKSKIEIDNICWTIRAQFYYAIGKYDLGWKCLKHMESTKVPITSVTINAIISGLDSKELYRESAELLRWALEKGANKDIVTYNLFIRAQMKEGLFKDATITLNSMKKEGIEPDIVTYCSVVNGLFSKKNARPPSMELIGALLAEMEQLGIRPNLYFFNTLLNGILTQYGDESAAKQILAMIPDESWRGSPITSNILIQHYARKNDFDSVEVVWENMTKYRTTPDGAVYGSTVELYAKARNATMAKFWLGRMMGARRRPTLRTFTKVLQCLLREGDLASAKRIYQDMIRLEVKFEGNREFERVISALRSSERAAPSAVNPSVW